MKQGTITGISGPVIDLPELDVCEQIEELSPIREYVLSVSVPENKPLHYELLNGKAVPVVKTAVSP